MQKPFDGPEQETANAVYVAFIAPDKAAGRCVLDSCDRPRERNDGKASPRPQCDVFVRDLDGHKIEAMWWGESKEALGHGS
jgi:hypothetical protein